MLQIKTYLAPDPFGGTGLFADEDIKQGQLILRYCHEFTRYIPVQEYFLASAEERKFLDTYTYPHFEPHATEPLIGVMLNLDNARYSNHSDTPNAGLDPKDDNLCIALRAIKKGEEITCSYREFDPDNILYKMGVVSCKGFLLDPSHPHYIGGKAA